MEKSLLHGPVPASLGQLVNLTTIVFDGNSLTGSIPTTLATARRIHDFQVQNNFVTGHIDSAFFETPHLGDFLVDENLITGTIPGNLGSSSLLWSVVFSGNKMHGTIPESVGSLVAMVGFKVDNNFISGTLPPGMANWGKLREIYLQKTNIGGTLPHWIGNWVNLTQLNAFDSHIPAGIANLTSLLIFAADTNLLTGSLPDGIDMMPVLTELSASYNLLTGTLPPPPPFTTKVILRRNTFHGIMSDLWWNTSKGILDVEVNELEGNLTALFSRNPLVNTTADFFILNINSNSFTGTVPDSIFAIDNLQSVVLSLNCFSGTLPATLCDSEGLVDLLMDGLHASPRCHYERFLNTKFHVDIFESAWQVHGSIPTCVWQLPNLQVLHLSGNSLQGSITLPTENVLVSFNQTIGWNKHIEITANESVAFGHVQERNGGARDPASPLGLVDASIVAWNLSLLETSLLRKPLNPAQQLRVIVARDFAVLLTFGVLFPPLLVIIALAMVVQIHMIQMLLGRLHAMTPSTASPLTAATRSYGHRLQQWLQKANLSFADFDRGLWQGLAMSVSVAAVFWSLSLFDILADSDGGNNAVHAVWILMVMATAPFWMYALDVAWRRGSQRSWGCPLLLRWPLPQPAQSAGDVGTTASASASATVGDDDGMAVDGDDIEMRSTRGTASTRATLSTAQKTTTGNNTKYFNQT
eukprot:gene5580-3989_t